MTAVYLHEIKGRIARTDPIHRRRDERTAEHRRRAAHLHGLGDRSRLLGRRRIGRARRAHAPDHDASDRGDPADGARQLARGRVRARRAAVAHSCRRVVLPTALAGIVTASLLAVARAIGETAPMLFTAFGSDSLNLNPFEGPQSDLPLFVFKLIFLAQPDPDRPCVDRCADPRPARAGALRQRAPRRAARHSNVSEEPDDQLCFPTPNPNGAASALRDVDAARPSSARRTSARGSASARCSSAARCTWTSRRVTALIGPSGCGKSTFIRILNRMHEVIPGAQIAGRVELDGVDIYGGELSATQVRTRIGMVFQKPNPFPAMSIGENVLAGLKLSRTRTSDRDALVEESLTRAGLWNEVKDRLNEGGMSLSGGQQQRLCIARALAVRPQVLLMDEPCSALDPISTRVVEETIAELAPEITIVIVTHNMQQAPRVSHQCAFFLVEEFGEPGRIVEVGETKKMFEAPDDPRTLDYVTGRFG